MPMLPLFDTLESRRLMSIVPVTNLNDTGPGSLRAAIESAAPGDTIDMRGLTGVLNNMQGPIGVNRSLTIIGSGESMLTIHGNVNDAVIINAVGTLTLKDMTISGGGNAASGGGIYNRSNLVLDHVTLSDNHAYLYGGGIYSQGGDVTLLHSTLSGNTAQGALESSGGAIYMVGGKLTIDSSTIYNNTATGASNGVSTSGAGTGGALYLMNTAVSTITNSTFGANTAQGGTSNSLATSGTASGGAIYINSASSTLFNSCTIAYNTAAGGGPSTLQTATSQGGGIYSTGGGTVSMLNTLAAENSATSGTDILSNTIASLGDNLVGVVTGNSTLNSLLGDKIGTTVAPFAPGLSNVLANNGGDTMTYALQSGSAAINNGSADAPLDDQRGLGRRTAPDIGAFEFDPNHLPVLTLATPVLNAVAGYVFTQPIAANDADGDPLTYTASNLPSWLTLQTVNGQPVLSGAPTEANAGTTRIDLSANDGFQTTMISFQVKVGIPSIDLSTRGLLRVNGTDGHDDIHVWARGDMVRVFRDGKIKNFAMSAVRSVQVYAFGGDDTITVGVNTLSSYVDAGDGDDKVIGGNGYDILSGGAGDDTIYGGGGTDRLNGNSGNDLLVGGTGNDRMYGGKGNDTLIGGNGIDQLFGEEGNDYFNAIKGGPDSIDGGTGNNSGVWNSDDTISNAVLTS